MKSKVELTLCKLRFTVLKMPELIRQFIKYNVLYFKLDKKDIECNFLKSFLVFFYICLVIFASSVVAEYYNLTTASVVLLNLCGIYHKPQFVESSF